MSGVCVVVLVVVDHAWQRHDGGGGCHKQLVALHVQLLGGWELSCVCGSETGDTKQQSESVESQIVQG